MIRSIIVASLRLTVLVLVCVGVILTVGTMGWEEGETFGPAMVIRGARERLAPILMTTLATGMALMPLLFYGDQPGREIEHPLAIVIIGGLVTSTLLTLFVVPSLYLRFGRRRGVTGERPANSA